MLFANDIGMVGENLEGINSTLKSRGETPEVKMSMISMSKTVHK